MNKNAMMRGYMTLETIMAYHPAWGASAESASDGCPNFSFLYQVIIV